MRSLPRLELPDVTLVAVTSVAIEATARAMRISLERARFGAALWLSDQPPPADLAGQVTWCKIDRLASRAAYSRFMLGALYGHIRTSHALCIQWDGYVLDAAAWDPAFLRHDYIGAPWPHFRDAHQVGNGGFSLRSRKLLEACATLPPVSEAEDVAICRVHRPMLEQHFGIGFADVELAGRFAYERGVPAGPTFGFHGVFNLIRHMRTAEAARLIAGLEPQIMAPNERREVMGWALRKGRWYLAWQVARRGRRS
jgi:hypothetical protein